MVERSASRKPAPSKSKLLLIPVLGAVLLYLVCGPSNDVASPPKLVRTAESSAALNSVSPATVAVSTTVGTTSLSKTSLSTTTMSVTEASQKPAVGSIPGSAVTWPATPLIAVLAVNPFKMPTELRPVTTVANESLQTLTPAEDLKQLEAEKLAELRAAVKGQRLTALVQTNKGVGAIVGDSVVSVGDLVGERLRVTAIRPEGVEVELIDKPIVAAPAAVDPKRSK